MAAPFYLYCTGIRPPCQEPGGFFLPTALTNFDPWGMLSPAPRNWDGRTLLRKAVGHSLKREVMRMKYKAVRVIAAVVIGLLLLAFLAFNVC